MPIWGPCAPTKNKFQLRLIDFRATFVEIASRMGRKSFGSNLLSLKSRSSIGYFFLLSNRHNSSIDSSPKLTETNARVLI